MKRLRGRALQQMRRRKQQDDPLCHVCLANGVVRGWDHLDHIKPLEDGGDNSWANLQGLCVQHHEEKTARDRGYTLKDNRKEPCGVSGVPIDPTHHWNNA